MKYMIVATYHNWLEMLLGVDVFHSDVCLDPKEMLALVKEVPLETEDITVSQSFSDDLSNPFTIVVCEAKNGKKTASQN